MSVINTKFSADDTCYTFDGWTGQIKRHSVNGLVITVQKDTTEILYDLLPPTSHNPLEEQELYTESEVKELANCWLLEKSISIFSKAGL